MLDNKNNLNPQEGYRQKTMAPLPSPHTPTLPLRRMLPSMFKGRNPQSMKPSLRIFSGTTREPLHYPG